VSFVLPAYNESSLIENTLERIDLNFKNNGFPYEILVVDDGSEDSTRSKAILYGLLNRNVKVISHKKNFGKGFAVNRGFKKAKGRAVVFFDSDADIEAEQINNYLRVLKNRDIVIGSKWHPNSNVEMPFLRKVFSRAFNVAVRLLTGLNIRDTQTGIKAIRREAFLDVFSRLCVKRYAYDVELLVLAKIFGLKVSEVPVKLRIKKDFSVKECWHMLMDLLGIAYRLRITKWYQREVSKVPDF
jgi:glycosyltransferase involved in cell wall biosynthesis